MLYPSLEPGQLPLFFIKLLLKHNQTIPIRLQPGALGAALRISGEVRDLLLQAANLGMQIRDVICPGFPFPLGRTLRLLWRDRRVR